MCAETPSSSRSAPVSLILASASPRRHELLAQIGVRYRVVVHDIDETPRPDESPDHYVARLAREKAGSVNALPEIRDQLPVLGADTIVVCDNAILGKPRDYTDAHRMLRMLSGRQHEVMTAVSLQRGDQVNTITVSTSVWFRPVADDEIRAYWQHGEPRGKAGAYAVQGLGALFIERIAGSYTGVVGLPLFETGQLLAEFGVETTLAGMQSSRRDVCE